MISIDIEAEVDRLYQAPANAFTAGRNELAQRLRSAGLVEEAQRVKALARPTMPAWAVNQVYWRARQDFDRVVRAGDAVREAQQAVFAGRTGDLRESLAARDGAIARATARAAGVLEEAGAPASVAIRRRLGATFDAIAAYGSAWTGPRGRLTADIDPPGFGALAALAARQPATARAEQGRGAARTHQGAGPARVLPMPPASDRPPRGPGVTADRKEAIGRLRAECAEAERDVRQRRREAEEAAAVEQAAARACDAARADVQEAERRLEGARDREERAARELGDARARRSRLRTALADAEQALARARAAIEEAT